MPTSLQFIIYLAIFVFAVITAVRLTTIRIKQEETLHSVKMNNTILLGIAANLMPEEKKTKENI